MLCFLSEQTLSVTQLHCKVAGLALLYDRSFNSRLCHNSKYMPCYTKLHYLALDCANTTHQQHTPAHHQQHHTSASHISTPSTAPHISTTHQHHHQHHISAPHISTSSPAPHISTPSPAPHISTPSPAPHISTTHQHTITSTTHQYHTSAHHHQHHTSAPHISTPSPAPHISSHPCTHHHPYDHRITAVPTYHSTSNERTNEIPAVQLINYAHSQMPKYARVASPTTFDGRVATKAAGRPNQIPKNGGNLGWLEHRYLIHLWG